MKGAQYVDVLSICIGRNTMNSVCNDLEFDFQKIQYFNLLDQSLNSSAFNH